MTTRDALRPVLTAALTFLACGPAGTGLTVSLDKLPSPGAVGGLTTDASGAVWLSAFKPPGVPVYRYDAAAKQWGAPQQTQGVMAHPTRGNPLVVVKVSALFDPPAVTPGILKNGALVTLPEFAVPTATAVSLFGIDGHDTVYAQAFFGTSDRSTQYDQMYQLKAGATAWEKLPGQHRESDGPVFEGTRTLLADGQTLLLNSQGLQTVDFVEPTWVKRTVLPCSAPAMSDCTASFDFGFDHSSDDVVFYNQSTRATYRLRSGSTSPERLDVESASVALTQSLHVDAAGTLWLLGRDGNTADAQGLLLRAAKGGPWVTVSRTLPRGFDGVPLSENQWLVGDGTEGNSWLAILTVK